MRQLCGHNGSTQFHKKKEVGTVSGLTLMWLGQVDSRKNLCCSAILRLHTTLSQPRSLQLWPTGCCGFHFINHGSCLPTLGHSGEIISVQLCPAPIKVGAIQPASIKMAPELRVISSLLNMMPEIKAIFPRTHCESTYFTGLQNRAQWIWTFLVVTWINPSIKVLKWFDRLIYNKKGISRADCCSV